MCVWVNMTNIVKCLEGPGGLESHYMDTIWCIRICAILFNILCYTCNVNMKLSMFSTCDGTSNTSGVLIYTLLWVSALWLTRWVKCPQRGVSAGGQLKARVHLGHLHGLIKHEAWMEIADTAWRWWSTNNSSTWWDFCWCHVWQPVAMRTAAQPIYCS